MSDQLNYVVLQEVAGRYGLDYNKFCAAFMEAHHHPAHFAAALSCAPTGVMEEAYWQGWCEAAEWARRDDLRADKDSQAYADAMHRRLRFFCAATPAASEQPVGEVSEGGRLIAFKELAPGTPLYASAASVQPVLGDIVEKAHAKVYGESSPMGPTDWSFAEELLDAFRVLSPPVPADVGMTDEEIDEIIKLRLVHRNSDLSYFRGFARAIIAAMKAKGAA